jgi:hypothetical protein
MTNVQSTPAAKERLCRMLYFNIPELRSIFGTYAAFKSHSIRVGAYHKMKYPPRKFCL